MENIYKKYRKLAGITQERAAEHLGVSIDSIKRYEGDYIIPNNELARQMCLLYGDMRLAYDHLANSSTGAMILDNLEDKDLCCSVVGLLNELSKTTDMQRKIIEITSDGVIDESEKQEWNNVEKQAKKLVNSCFELIFRRE